MNTIDFTERQGMLRFIRDGFHMTMVGNFSLSSDGTRVVARRIRGRNRWVICRIEAVLTFDEVKK